jgi:hypothetical protein
VIKTTNGSHSTLYSQNNGFYRFYCEATDSYGKTVTSNIAEVAVGCGAKNNSGEWISFMCFNLGAANDMTIEKQKTHTFSPYQYASGDGLHPYVSGEEEVWGDLFQWGRIADGHEKRQSPVQAGATMPASDIGSGSRCSSSDTNRPWYQVKKTSTWYGKFITAGEAQNYNWTPVAQSTADQLWRTSRFVPNDPCTHYKADGTYQEFWHEGTDQTSTGIAACTDAGTGWRAPLQEEWGVIYKGGASSGSPAIATANTWRWYNTEGNATSGLTKTRGYEIQPDNVTTTLFLPAGGSRGIGSGQLYYQGVGGFYWSTSIIGISSAYRLTFDSSNVNPANSNYRASGFALRCVKNS